MGFRDLSTIHTAEQLTDIAFLRATKVNAKLRKDKDLKKIETVRDALTERLERILDTYPRFDNLDPFYQELTEKYLDVDQSKKALGAVRWANGKVKLLSADFYRQARGGQDVRKAFYGRISSVLKQIDGALVRLEKDRKILRKMPNFKTGMKTVAIVGFPNVGKTTLLYELTGSKGKIEEYAFTTQGVNLAYHNDLQFVDTPGTLHRNKMNNMEWLTVLILDHLANEIIYVFDPTEASAPLADQKELYEEIKAYDLPMHVYVSKAKGLAEYNPKSIEELKTLFITELVPRVKYKQFSETKLEEPLEDELPIVEDEE